MQEPFFDVFTIGRGEGVWADGEEVEGGEDEVGEEHAGGIEGLVDCWEEGFEASFPVAGVESDV